MENPPPKRSLYLAHGQENNENSYTNNTKRQPMTYIYRKEIWENNICYSVDRHNIYKFKNAVKAKACIVTARLSEGTNGIEQGAFRGCARMTSVYIPSGVGVIEEDAFRDCTGLKSVFIPYGVLRIEANAFYGCYNLESVVIPNSVTTIGKGAFKNCKHLTAVTLPQDMDYFAADAFQGCRRLCPDIKSQLQQLIQIQHKKDSLFSIASTEELYAAADALSKYNRDCQNHLL